MQHDLTIYQCAQALRDGRDPIEVADMLDGVADSMNRDAEHGASIDLTNPGEALEMAAEIVRRLQALHDAMRECAKKEALHPSVRFICDTIALNLATAAPVDLWAGKRVRIKGDGKWRGYCVRSHQGVATVLVDNDAPRSFPVGDLVAEDGDHG